MSYYVTEYVSNDCEEQVLVLLPVHLTPVVRPKKTEPEQAWLLSRFHLARNVAVHELTHLGISELTPDHEVHSTLAGWALQP